MIVLISLGGVFEFYDLFFTAYVAPGMVKSGLFTPESLGPIAALKVIGQAGFGTFVFATFAGLWVGALILGNVADRYGRRKVFVWSLHVVHRLLGDHGLPDDRRSPLSSGASSPASGSASSWSRSTPTSPSWSRAASAAAPSPPTSSSPTARCRRWPSSPGGWCRSTPFGFDGWRWVVLIGTVGAVVVWFLQLGIPESPRWLAKHGRNEEAERIVARIEAGVEAELGRTLPPPVPEPRRDGAPGRLAEAFAPAYRSRTIMLSVFNFFQTIGFYGFADWVPTLLIARGINITQSLEYSFIIAIANPFGPLIGTLFSDKIERKWQIVGGATGMLILMAIFAQLSDPAALIVVGVLFTLCANVMSYAFHNYQAELFPTRIRARAIGFVYSWSRISAAFSGLAIGYFLHSGGVSAVAIFIGIAMLVVIGVIGFFGPATKELALEQIAR